MSSRSFRVGRALTGLGLFATKPIKRLAYIATYRGRRISGAEADRLEARGSRYMFEINSRWTIDGSPRWNLARYINHSSRQKKSPSTTARNIWIISCNSAAVAATPAAAREQPSAGSSGEPRGSGIRELNYAYAQLKSRGFATAINSKPVSRILVI